MTFVIAKILVTSVILITKARSFVALIATTTLLISTGLAASELRGTVGVKGMFFSERPLFTDSNLSEDQSDARWQPTAQITLDGSRDFGRDTKFDVTVFGRASPHAHHRFGGDIREADLKIQFENAEIKAGILAETWGTLEAWNLVDIINQRDLAEDFQGDAKLGQPGVAVSLQQGDWVWSLAGLTYARERRFAEGQDRLRALPAPILTEKFEGNRWNPGIALRVQSRWDDLDIAASHYAGHAREPLFQSIIGQQGLLGFESFYEKIAQTALEAQYVMGDSVLKSEFIYQTEGVDSFWGSGVGVETTFNKLGGSFESLTFYFEAYFDDRSDSAPLTAFQRDIFFGARYNLNDTDDTVFEARYTHDLEWDSNLIDLRASRRIFGDCLLSAQLLLPLAVERDPALIGFEQDKYFKLGLDWYF